MRTQTFPLLLAVTLLAASCGGGGDGRGPSIDDEGLCADISQTVCSNLYDCCSEGQIESYLNVDEPRTENDCRRDVRLRCEDNLAAQFWSVQEGRATVNDNIGDCLATLRPTETCFELVESDPSESACDIEFFRGLLGAGESCLFNHECQDDSFCAPNQTCEALPTIGETCSAGGCGDGYCDFALNQCAVFKTAGETCSANQECLGELYCDTVAVAPTCRALIEGGLACAGNQECESGQCFTGTCGIAGNSCFTDDQCSGTCQGTGSFCGEFNPCSGTCEGTGSFCGEFNPCSGTCEGTGSFCSAGSPCSGTCSTGGNSCTTAAIDCQVGETCDIPTCDIPTCNTPTCNFVECIGDIVCASDFLIIDYCELGQQIF